MSERSHEIDSFRAVQYQFAGHIRNPDQVQMPEGVDDRRMKVYRELFYNNIEGFLAGNFPVFKSLSDESYWHSLVRDFMTKHRCQTPYFLEIGQEFMQYVSECRTDCTDDPVFMQELLHYEWVELALDSSTQEIPTEGIDPEGDLLTGVPVQSPLAWSLSYEYPVHQIGPGFQPDEPSQHPVYLLVYRDRSDQVQFMEINAVTARMLFLMQQQVDASGRALLEQIASELNHADIDVVIAGGAEVLENLRQKGVILGTRISG